MNGGVQIGRLLASRFAVFDGTPYSAGRIVFWHDEHGEFADQLDGIAGPDAADETLRDVQIVRLERNPFALKHRMLIEQPTEKFLVYLTGKLPKDEDNWLLDLELAYGPLFTADKLSMIVNELFPREASAATRDTWLTIMQRTKPFFEDDELVESLASRLRANDDERDFQAKMIAVLLGLPAGEHSLQSIWRQLLEHYARGDTDGIERIKAMGLLDYHWTGTRGIYRFDSADELAHPTVKDFVLWLFRLAWNGFSDAEHGADYYANIRRDFDMWRNDPRFAPVMRTLAEDVFSDLSLDHDIARMGLDELVSHGVFREVDEQLVELLYADLGNENIADDDVQRIVASRQYGLWHDDFTKDYAVIAAASALRAQLRAARPVMASITSTQAGFRIYADDLYRVDGCYRRFIAAWKASSRPFSGRMVAESLEQEYARYQADLGIAWQTQVNTMTDWSIDDVPSQTDFYVHNVKKTIDAGKKIAVIISDALRYDVAAEFRERLTSQSRWNATMDAQLGVLPSYTQLGMAALLPHATLALDPADHYFVLADDQSTKGTNARTSILSSVNGIAVDAETLMNMKRDEYRELVKSCNVLYVYHNVIDATGDKAASASDVFGACDRALDDLDSIVKRLANANVTNMIVTADHGFLYQDHDVTDAEWLSENPSGDVIWQKKRRFVIGSNLANKPAFVTFSASQVGLGDPNSEHVTIQIPNGIHRLRLQGDGARYVHGGAALPEIVVPVIHINKGRSASGDARRVEFRILQNTDRITTGQITVDFLQTEPVGGKISERTVLAGLWGVEPDGQATLISNEVPLAFSSTSKDSAERHVPATFLLTTDADRFNNTVIELQLSERIPGSSQTRRLDTKAEYRLQRGLVIDDGFDF
ncbi:BREX-1 system phosphatase PglZ type A [Bifidobacterium callitrichidarum]|uniref:BREX-1 system phosphatase PglZ type A n=1 Tax=Bifidobacterium callitrichidarum TaxID=2052941 RepID=A0A2U2NBE7_9BIFI|nr:BREX-1 system phosphatase PglZ type A [Bifidobacterium callitrichidarum]PWG66476.1 BREX-1 system phosphatase PglZ type A [Bifidobacterium callitrichidarum]